MTRTLRRSLLALSFLVWASSPLFAQNNLFDLRVAEVNSNGELTYQNLSYTRFVSDGRFLVEGGYLHLPTFDYNEGWVGVGYRVIKQGGFQVYALAQVAAGTESAYFEPAILVSYARGKWAANAFMQRYSPAQEAGLGQWLWDPLEIQYTVAGRLALGASVYLYKADGGTWQTKVGPKASVSDKYGATEFRITHVNEGPAYEFQFRRIFVF